MGQENSQVDKQVGKIDDNAGSLIKIRRGSESPSVLVFCVCVG